MSYTNYSVYDYLNTKVRKDMDIDYDYTKSYYNSNNPYSKYDYKNYNKYNDLKDDNNNQSYYDSKVYDANDDDLKNYDKDILNDIQYII